MLKVSRRVKIPLVHVGSIWFEGIYTLWDKWRLCVVQNLCSKFFFYSSCKQYIIWEYRNILAQKIIHEDLAWYSSKLLASFIDFSCMLLWAQNVLILFLRAKIYIYIHIYTYIYIISGNFGISLLNLRNI